MTGTIQGTINSGDRIIMLPIEITADMNYLIQRRLPLEDFVRDLLRQHNRIRPADGRRRIALYKIIVKQMEKPRVRHKSLLLIERPDSLPRRRILQQSLVRR